MLINHTMFIKSKSTKKSVFHLFFIKLIRSAWVQISLSLETQKTLMHAVSTLPGRMRVCWIVNTNWMLTSAMAVAKFILSEKIMGRMKNAAVEDLLEEIPAENVPNFLGGSWEPKLETEWYEISIELDKKAAREANGGEEPKKELEKEKEEKQVRNPLQN